MKQEQYSKDASSDRLTKGSCLLHKFVVGISDSVTIQVLY